ncbi:hypothetical protein D3C81_1743660 [compost metagenome]
MAQQSPGSTGSADSADSADSAGSAGSAGSAVSAGSTGSSKDTPQDKLRRSILRLAKYFCKSRTDSILKWIFNENWCDDKENLLLYNLLCYDYGL